MILIPITRSDISDALPEGFVALCLAQGAVTAAQAHSFAQRLVAHCGDRATFGVEHADAEAAVVVLAPYAWVSGGPPQRTFGLCPPDPVTQAALPRPFSPLLLLTDNMKDEP
jgi:hypothetical protein